MHPGRNSLFLAGATALVVSLCPAVARADGIDGLATLFALILGAALSLAVGIGAVVAALLVRSHALWLFALLVAAANGVMGVMRLFADQGELTLFNNFASLQVVLALFACPSLVAWRVTEREGQAPATESLQTPHWLLLWVLGHVGVGLVGTLVTFPLTSTLIPRGPGGAASSVQAMLVVSGAVNGALLGGLQWLLLRKTLGVSALWIALTALGTATAAFVTTALTAQLALAGLIGGAVLGLAQWPLLRGRVANAWLWIVLCAAVRLAYLPAGPLYSSAPAMASVVLHALSGLMTLLIGLALQRLARGYWTSP